MYPSKNIFGEVLVKCSEQPLTGYYRNDCCDSGPQDQGKHMVCVIMTDEFLRFSKSRGNDLSTPLPQYQFPGLKAGDKWCLCVLRWKEAYEAGMAPFVDLEATHEESLNYVTMEMLLEYAYRTSDKT